MTIGPVEYIIVGFPGNKFTGDIAPALANLIDNKTIRILDLIFVAKDADGDVVAFEFDELDELGGLRRPRRRSRRPHHARTTSRTRPRASNRTRPPRCSSGKTCGQRSSLTAVRDSGGVLLEGGRIPHELVEAAFADLPAAT